LHFSEVSACCISGVRVTSTLSGFPAQSALTHNHSLQARGL
jgi:hypothetical protein